ncbi:MAG TPA: FAD-dependent oxidoreductase [Thermomicrobiaceae bacterium]|nr:FAD-dependent oxidoreductase [Thermomicrobiaceae bacterium]
MNHDETSTAVSERQDIALRLLDRQHETEDVVSFHFEPDRPVAYRAGQFLHYTLPHPDVDDRGIERYFTIASAPSESSIALTTRLPRESSSFKQALGRMEPGTVISVSEPSGRFVYRDGQPRAVFIAGGIGITPFRSILVELSLVPVDAEITLLYANRTPDIAFRPLFDSLVRAHPRLEVVYVVSQPTAGWTGSVGRIDAAFIARYVPEVTAPLFYVSGPEAMVKTIGLALADLGVRRERIKRESFPGYGA